MPLPGPVGVPGPVARLHVGGDIAGLGPGLAVVARTGDEDAVVVAVERQPDHAGRLIDDGARIADRDLGIAPFLVDQLELAPRLAAVGAPLLHQVEIAVIAAAVLATFADGEQRPLLRHDEGRDAVGVIAFLAGGEGDGFGEVGGEDVRGREHECSNEGDEQLRSMLDIGWVPTVGAIALSGRSRKAASLTQSGYGQVGQSFTSRHQLCQRLFERAAEELAVGRLAQVGQHGEVRPIGEVHERGGCAGERTAVAGDQQARLRS